MPKATLDDVQATISARFIPTPLPPAGERRPIRERAGFTVVEAGARVGCHYTSIIGWERGKEPSKEFRKPYWEFLDACQRGVIRELTAAA
jgi:hypothetical protein